MRAGPQQFAGTEDGCLWPVWAWSACQSACQAVLEMAAAGNHRHDRVLERDAGIREAEPVEDEYWLMLADAESLLLLVVGQPRGDVLPYVVGVIAEAGKERHGAPGDLLRLGEPGPSRHGGGVVGVDDLYWRSVEEHDSTPGYRARVGRELERSRHVAGWGYFTCLGELLCAGLGCGRRFLAPCVAGLWR